MADLKSEKIANEIVRLENLLPGLQIEKEKAGIIEMLKSLEERFQIRT